jgi:hypothetical protein
MQCYMWWQPPHQSDDSRFLALANHSRLTLGCPDVASVFWYNYSSLFPLPPSLLCINLENRFLYIHISTVCTDLLYLSNFRDKAGTCHRSPSRWVRSSF